MPPKVKPKVPPRPKKFRSGNLSITGVDPGSLKNAQNSKVKQNLNNPGKVSKPRAHGDDFSKAGGQGKSGKPGAEMDSRTGEPAKVEGVGDAATNKKGKKVEKNQLKTKSKRAGAGDNPDANLDGIDDAAKKKTAGKVARETFGKAVKLATGALLLHQMGIIDITDPLSVQDGEAECIEECEDKGLEGEKLGSCIKGCKDTGGKIIATIVNVIMFIILGVIIFNLGKKILKKKGTIGGSSDEYDEDYDFSF